MRGRNRNGDLVVWAAMGLGVGLLAGFALAEAVGTIDPKRVDRALERLSADPSPTPLSPTRAARTVVVALARFPEFADQELEVRGLTPGRVELLGWVADRRLRALAERTAATVPGITAVVNRLLVQDEDSDADVGLELADQPA